MAWADVIIPAVRIIINDDGEIATYSDDRLELTAVVAAQLIISELTDLENDYTISIPLQTIDPDPTDAAYLDNNFINLLIMKTCCFIDQSTLRTKAAAAGISARLGPAALDTNGQLNGFLKILEVGPCKAYEQLKFELMFGDTGVCHAIMSAFVNNSFDPSFVTSRDGSRFGAYPQ